MSLTSPKYSIVIPLYNKAATIGATLATVWQQRFADFEVLLVNDGSTDNSMQVVQTIEDNRLHVISKKNGGVSSARNLAIKEAKGELIAFLDADDLWHPDYLLEMNNLINDYPFCGLYACAFQKLTKQKTVIKGAGLPHGLVEDFFKARIDHQVPFTSATIVRRKVFENVGGFPEGMIGGEDDYTWTKIALKYRVAFLPKPLVTYNFIQSSIAFRKGRLDTCKENWFDFMDESNFYQKEFIAQKAIHAGIRYALGGPQLQSREIERKTAYTRLSKKEWKQLYFLNRMHPFAMPFYKLFKALIAKFKTMLNYLKSFKKPYLNTDEFKWKGAQELN